MAGMLYSGGRDMNIAGRGPGALTMSSENSIYGKANAIDGYGQPPAMFNVAGVDDYIKKDVCAIANPGFETAGLASWTNRSLGTGTAVETTTAGEFRTGARALKCSGTDASNYGAETQDFNIAPGEWWKLDAWGRKISGATGTARIRIILLELGLYWNGSAWTTTPSDAAATVNTPAFAALTTTLQMPSYDTAQIPRVTCRLQCWCNDGVAAFDDVLFLPGVNGAHVPGHNFGAVVPLLQSSDDDSAYTTRITMTPKRPAFYGYDSTMRYARYWRQLFQGTNFAAGYFGEWNLLQWMTTTFFPLEGYTETPTYAQVRHNSESGQPWRYLMNDDAPIGASLDFQLVRSAELLTFAQDIHRRTRGGTDPIVVVPNNGEASVYFGVAPAGVEISREVPTVWHANLTIEPMGLPFVGL